MKAELHSISTIERSWASRFGWPVATTAILASLLAATSIFAGDPPAKAAKEPAVQLQSIPASNVMRIILTPKAAQRLGIETGKVGEQVVIPKQMVSGLVVPALSINQQAPEQRPHNGGGFGGFGSAGQPGMQKKIALTSNVATPASAPASALAPSAAARQEVWVQVALTKSEWDKVVKDKPAHITALPTREQLPSEILAMLHQAPPVEDVRRSMLNVHYIVPGRNHGLALNNRMRVELQMAGSEEVRKVIPYSSVYYDAHGVSWVYLNPQPLAYERQRIVIERVVGNLAVLSEGPPLGAAVVTTGVSLLHGAELFKK